MLSPVTPSDELFQPNTSIDMQYILSSDSFNSRNHKKKTKRPNADGFRSCSLLPEYFTRVLDYRQMDLDATFYQMVTLCVQPAKVYKSAYYRKQTKNRWARDDPAFVVIQLMFLLMATFAWALAFRVDTMTRYFSLLLHAIFLLAPMLTSDSFVMLLVGNLLYSLGWGFYTYITFLGYMALPFLHRTEQLLLPLVVILALFLSTLVLQAVFGVQINFAHISTHYYYAP
ncbi:hypothetical protein KXD40_008223 [Peronospora effusa]|nr:hypothetical protein KXD40_008223 [Peronospora effusa]